MGELLAVAPQAAIEEFASHCKSNTLEFTVKMSLAAETFVNGCLSSAKHPPITPAVTDIHVLHGLLFHALTHVSTTTTTVEDGSKPSMYVCFHFCHHL
jgi:hypothetical protein